MGTTKRGRGSSTGSLHTASPSAYEKPKPSFSVDEDELPAIKDWAVGKKYKITATVEMVSHSKGEYSYDSEPKKHKASLKVISVSPAEGKKD